MTTELPKATAAGLGLAPAPTLKPETGWTDWATSAIESARGEQLKDLMPSPISYMDADAASAIWDELAMDYQFLHNQDAQMIGIINWKLETGGYTAGIEVLPTWMGGGYREDEMVRGGPGAAMAWAAEKIIPMLARAVVRQRLNRKALTEDIEHLTASMDRHSFYASLYSEVPLTIITGEVSSVEDVMRQFDLPPELTASEVSAIREIVIGMFSIISQSPEALQELATYGLEGFEYDFFPQLVAPVEVPPPAPVGIHKLSVDEIVKYLATPKTPEGTMTNEEWHDLLKSEGYSQEDIDDLQHLKDESTAMVANWSKRRETIEEIRANTAALPDYKILDFLKDLLVYPTLALMEPLHRYFELVTMPTATHVYRHFAPGLDAEYQRLRQEYGPWEAARKAWVDWDYNWFIKYIIMEGFVDPMSYVGFGIAGRVGKGLATGARLGRIPAHRMLAKPFQLAGAAEYGMMQVFELPFDAIKSVWRGMPKTLAQRATLATSDSSKFVRHYYEQFSRFLGGSRYIHSVTPEHMRVATDTAIDYALKHPFSDHVHAQAGRHMLNHAPIDNTLLQSWATDLGSKLKPEQFTRQTIANVDEVFEHYFWNLITQDEAAARLLQILNVPGAATRAQEGVAFAAAKRMLSARSTGIKNIATSHLAGDRATDIMKRFNKRTYKITETTLVSAAYRARSEIGAFSALMVGVDMRLSALWRNSIDKWVVRPFAEAYLTFGMYGPMNVLEDYVRCTLGGVRPGSMKQIDYQEAMSGLKYSPDMLTPGYSEMMGPLPRAGAEGAHNNWLLTGMFVGPGRAAWMRRKLILGPGGRGADIRRFFHYNKMQQILAADKSGRLQRLRALAKGDLKKLGIGSEEAKAIEQSLTRVLPMADPPAIGNIKKMFTEHELKVAEINKTLSFYPEIENEIRADIMSARRSGLLDSDESVELYFKGPGGYEEQMRERFLHSPGLATQEAAGLERVLMDFNVNNPQDLAQALQSLHRIQSLYGGMPDQIITQATIHTRGLPIAKRRVAFNSYLDDLTGYIESAGASIDNIVEKLRRVAHEPHMAGVIDWTKVKIHRNVPGAQRANIQKWCDNLPMNIRYNIKEIKFDPKKCAEIHADAYWNPETRTLGYADASKATEEITYHEIGHSIMEDLLDQRDVEVIAGFADAIGQTEFAAALRRGAPVSDDALRIVHENFATRFSAWCRDRRASGKLQAFFDEHFPLTQRPLDLPQDYLSGSQRLIDNWTGLRMLGDEFAMENMAFRRQYFAEATKEQMKSPAFWKTFENGMKTMTDKFNKSSAALHGDISRNISGMNRAMGGGVERAPIIVEGRALSPADVGALLEVRNDDITSHLLSATIVHNNKDYFIEYVRGMTTDLDVGFTREAIGNCYDQMVYSLGHTPESVSWISGRMQQLDGLRQDLHRVHNAQMMSKKQRTTAEKYLDDLAGRMEKEIFHDVLPGKIPKVEAMPRLFPITGAKRTAGPEIMREMGTTAGNLIDPFFGSGSVPLAMKQSRRIGGNIIAQEASPELLHIHRMASEHPDELLTAVYAIYERHGDKITHAEAVVLRDAFNAGIVDEVERAATLMVFTRHMERNALAINAAGKITGSTGIIKRTVSLSSTLREEYRVAIEASAGVKVTAASKDSWVDMIRKASPGDIIYLDPPYLGRGRAFKYPGESQVGRWTVQDLDRLLTEAVSASKRGIRVVMSESAGLKARLEALGFSTRSITFGRGFKGQPYQELIASIGPPPKTTVGKTLKPEWADWEDVRQSACDEASKWYYKEYPDYVHGNFIDALMKTIYPYWTYESQRWFWLPRAFLRHPGLATTGGRWLDNTDRGYIHVPGTSIDINPFRGTVFGVMTTRLMRRDYPEYYDQLPFLGNFVEFNDYLSRWGFYPGAHISFPLAFMGGVEAQLGETLPAVGKTPLNALIAMFPDKKSGMGAAVDMISERLFNDRFRDYVTILEMNNLGYNGSHIWSKMEEGKKITPEEEAAWTSSRRSAAIYGMGFEQFGLFRLRSDEQYAVYREAAAIIEGMTGFTADQQQWLREHGQSVWDIVGGLSPTEQAILQELEYYRWVGSSTPLLPSEQQKELTALDVAWSDVDDYVTMQRKAKDDLDIEFLNGIIGPDAYQGAIGDIYDKQRTFIENKMEEYPLMRLENRAEYYEKYGLVQPVQHPMRELLNLYFDVELKDTYDDVTGEKTRDWDTFWAERRVIEMAIPEYLRGEWEMYLSRHATPMEMLRRQSWNEYFRTYYAVWEAVIDTYSEQEQALLREFQYLQRTGQKLDRQAQIKSYTSDKTGNLLISSFRSDVSANREALRAANPMLDAWLYYWGRSTSFKTPQAQWTYERLLLSTGRAGSSVY